MKTLTSLLVILGLSVVTSVASVACAPAEEDAESSEADVTSGPSAAKISTIAQFNALSTEGGGFGQAGRLMKFFIDSRDRGNKHVYFLNANYQEHGETPDWVKYHYYFAQHALNIPEDTAEFNDVTYFSDDKRYYAGSIQTYQIDDGPPLFAIQLYPDDVIHEAGIVELVDAIKKQLNIPDARMAFVAGGPQQTFATVKDQLKQRGYEALTVEEILGNVKYLPLNPGEAYGYLRVFPKDSGNLRPTDIVVFDELPLDLTVVAGTVTRVYQDVTSHVNLKSKERGTPNMVLRDAATNADLKRFADKPIRLVVGKTGYTIEATTDAIVQQKFKDRTNKPWQELPVVAEKNLVRYDDMCKVLDESCTKNGNRFGGKGAMLGFLANRSVLGRKSQAGSPSAKAGYDLVPFGFSIPVQWYRDLINAPENTALKAKIDDLVKKEKAGSLSPNERATLSKDVQNAFYVAKVPAAQLAAVNAEIANLKTLVPAMQKMKFRSSANAEDIPNFDGAGLHDSFSVKLSSVDAPDLACHIEEEPDGVATKREIKPKTPQCGIKGVFASLWNTRAIEERSFARLDHGSASMGIAVVPEYDAESEVAANGVLITRSVNSDFLAYTLSLQQGNNLVTNPDPGTISQMTFATFSDPARPPRFTVARFATPTVGAAKLTKSVLPEATMGQIVDYSRMVEEAYCRVKPGYYDNDCTYVAYDESKPRSLDLEFKYLRNGQFVIKQAREFHGH